LPAAAIFVSTLLLGRRSRRALSIGLIAFAFISVVLGLAQLAQGEQSGLRFYGITNPGEAVGFFANRNHFAALLYSLLPFTAAWAVSLADDRRPQMWVGLALCLLIFASLLLGLGMSHSRAGIILAMLGGLGSLALARTGTRSRAQSRAHRFIFLGGLVGAALVLQFASIGILQVLEKDLAEDLRWELAAETAQIAVAFQPLGSGIGTYEPIYRMHEEVARLRNIYANHAHNDYLELLLEGGAPAVLLLAAFVAWLSVQSVRSWSTSSPGQLSALDASIPRAATIAIVLLCLHSAVDYPLRTTAISSLFAFCCALLVAPVRSGSEPGSEGVAGRRRRRRVERRSGSVPLAL
jgi:O-antigen ligase